MSNQHAPFNCQNCKHSYFSRIGVAICRMKKIEIPCEKLNIKHKEMCKDYMFWMDIEKEKGE
jgi:hypothetical protein